MLYYYNLNFSVVPGNINHLTNACWTSIWIISSLQNKLISIQFSLAEEYMDSIRLKYNGDI